MSITCRDVTFQHSKHLSNQPFIRDLNTTFSAGSMNALVGPNGSGKTTIIKLLSGISRPNEGVINVDDIGAPHEPSVRRMIATTFDDDGLYLRLNGWENLQFYGSFFSLTSQQVRQRAEGWLRKWDLTPYVDTRVAAWSKGMRQKLAIIRTILSDAKIMLFDEAWNGLSSDAREELIYHLETLSQAGKTVIFSSHDLQEVSEHSQYLYVLKQGTVYWHGKVDTLNHPKLRVAVDSVPLLPDTFPYVYTFQDKELTIEVTENTDASQIINDLVRLDVKIRTANLEDGLGNIFKDLDKE